MEANPIPRRSLQHCGRHFRRKMGRTRRASGVQRIIDEEPHRYLFRLSHKRKLRSLPC